MTDHTHVDDPRVAALLAAAAAPAEAPLPGEAEALVAFRSVLQPRRRFHLMSRKSENAKLVAAAVFGGAVVLTGAAAAATGSLPGVGHSHSHPTPAASHAPNDSQDATETGDTQDSTDIQDSTDTQTTTGSVSTLDQNQGKGAEISALAHSLSGGHKGKVICVVASGGKCQAGQHGQSGASTHGKANLPHGQSDATTHGQAGLTHGQAGATTHGQAGLTHGQAGQAHGQSSTS